MRSILPTTARQADLGDVVHKCKYSCIHDVCKLICVKSTQGISSGMMGWTSSEADIHPIMSGEELVRLNTVPIIGGHMKKVQFYILWFKSTTPLPPN